MKAMDHKMLYVGEILYSKMDYAKNELYHLHSLYLGQKNVKCKTDIVMTMSQREKKTKIENCVCVHTFE